jgi:dolichol kinase
MMLALSLPFAFSILAVCAALLLGREAKAKNLYAAAITSSILAAAVTAVLLGQLANLAAFAIGTAVLSCLIAMCYISRPWTFNALLLFLAITVIACIYYYGDTALVGMFGIGSVCGLLYHDSLNPAHSTKKKRNVETNRDVVQIFLGVIVFALLFLLNLPYATYAAFALVVAGYAVNSLFAGRGAGSVYERVLATLERSNTTYGIGAVYLAVGTMLVIGFVGSKALMLFGIAALFFADSIATIVGMNFGRMRMPHNRSKTLEGTVAFFLVLALIGLPLIGLYALPLAAVLAAIESMKAPLDDNLRSGIAMAVLGIALRL